ncbi:MAG: DUF808 domain-containing protein [Deltaproteobacteria bacterium]|nr:DUF808 domain-containing protein [Deltaproteobacteria bacterium]
MAGFSLLALLDDVAAVLDDVALMTKMAAKKTVGVVGDDLALTARQVFGVKARREWPVVLAVAKGSLLNKLLLIPAALAVSRWAPFVVRPLLMVGGAWLCLEGGEKAVHYLGRKLRRGAGEARPAAQGEGGPAGEPVGEAADVSPAAPPSGEPAQGESTADGSVDALDEPLSPEAAALEKKKIKGAVRTDFVLSAEIVVITLSALPPQASLAVKTGILLSVGALMTAVVYGFAAGILKLDDLGFWLTGRSRADGFGRRLGTALIGAAPWLMRLLSVVGTVAMFLVGGGILVHGLGWLQAIKEAGPLRPALFDGAVGLAVGLALLSAAALAGRARAWLRRRRS